MPPSAASEPVVAPELSPRSSIINSAGNRSRISSARSGWRSRYSRRVGFSPRRWRSRNSSARTSTGLRESLEVDIGWLLSRGWTHGQLARLDRVHCGLQVLAWKELGVRGAPYRCSFGPGIDDRIALRRLKARMERLP